MTRYPDDERPFLAPSSVPEGGAASPGAFPAQMNNAPGSEQAGANAGADPSAHAGATGGAAERGRPLAEAAHAATAAAHAAKAAYLRSLRRVRVIVASISITGLVMFFALLGIVAYELRSSGMQAKVLARIAGEMTYEMGTGPSHAIRFPDTGPYDLRLGYAHLPSFIDSLEANGYAISAQARVSRRFTTLLDRGVFPIYREKTQAGFSVLDPNDRAIWHSIYPERVYAGFDSIPPLVVQSLLFVENRELLDQQYPHKNPVIEWDRLARAAFDWAWGKVNTSHQVPGGSTLATQIEKFRHSPEGQTMSAGDKLRQMASGSLRAYMDGETTFEARRRIVLDYLNSTPLSARPGFGEVIGIGDGLWAWYGVEFDEVNRLLAGLPPGMPPGTPARGVAGAAEVAGPAQAAATAQVAAMARPDSVDDEALANARALAYKQALSLLLVARRPSYYLLTNHPALERLTNAYLEYAANQGLISSGLRDRARAQKLAFRVGTPEPPEISYVERKAANAVRNRVRVLLGVERLYDLDRLDLRVKSTFASVAQSNVSAALRDLSDPNSKLCHDLWSSGVLSGPDPRKVNYSFTLYECGADANFLRVQSDNIDQPFDLNEGAKLELGSTAKLRTLVTYLEIIATLHSRYRGMTARDLNAVIVPPGDHLTRWAIDYFLANGDPSLSEMLEAAMDRVYSASPYEGFFTGGGMHTFSNFNADDNERKYSVRSAFHNSVNLVFIRLMRDIVRHTMYQTPGMSAHIFDERDDPKRRELLERFADREGRVFLDRFYKKYRGMAEDAALEKVLETVRPTPRKLSAFYRTVFPSAPFTEYLEFMRARLPRSTMSDGEFGVLYETYSPNVMSLADRGYVAGVHPLELWLVSYLRDNPNAGRQSVLDASARERIDVYEWLFTTSRKNAQDSKIRFMLEMEAFLEIHRAWQRLGYPFGSLVPSYATSIGSSGDRPAALSELLGIILNDGVRRPALRIREFHFAEGTPFETVMEPAISPPEQVLAPEIAHVVREALLGVVEQGTARRAIGAFKDANGDVIPVGGKTGTGDNRYDVYGRHGQLISSRAVSRVATFVFTIGDNYFGAITAYVPGEEADLYGFTSSLPVEILKRLAPALEPLIAQSAAESSRG